MRTSITYVPWAVDVKAGFQRAMRRIRRRPFEHDFCALENLLADGDLCLDVGANRGQSIDALRLLSHDVRILAFEPQEELFKRLVKRFRDDTRVRVVQSGAGADAHFAELFVPYYNGYLFDGLASLDEAEASDWLRGRIYRFDPNKLEVRRMPCEIVRLDDVVADERVAFIKLDIQGTELDALRGAVWILERDRPHLLVEAPSDDLVAFVGQFDYRPYAYVGDRLVENERGTLNTFFLAR